MEAIPPPDGSYAAELMRQEELLEELLADDKFGELGRLLMGFIHQLQKEALLLQELHTETEQSKLAASRAELAATIARFEVHAPTFYVRQFVRDSAAAKRLPDDFWESIEAETERAVVLVSAQAVDNACLAAIEAVRERTKAPARKWRRPTFDQAVSQCAELGILDKATETGIQHVRSIRNRFAHHLEIRSISVDGEVRDELREWFETIEALDYAPDAPRVDRLVFARACIVLVLRLEYARKRIVAGHWPEDCPITASAPNWNGFQGVAEEWARWFRHRPQST